MKQWVKVAIGTGLIVALFVAVDWRSMASHLRQLPWYVAALAFFGYAVQFAISGWKWSWALRVLEVRLPTPHLVRLYCISHFVGQFLPSGIGGDAYRSFRTMSASDSRTRSISAIVIERAVGLSALLLLGAAAAVQLTTKFTIAKMFLAAVVAGAAISVILLIAVDRGALKPLTNRLRRFNWFTTLQQDYYQLRLAGRRWIPLCAISLLFQSVSISITHMLFIGVGAQSTLTQSTLIVAIAGLASMLPISINGLGVTEGSIVGTAVALGLNPEKALLVGILPRLLVLPQTLLCGLMYISERRGTVTAATTP